MMFSKHYNAIMQRLDEHRISRATTAARLLTGQQEILDGIELLRTDIQELHERISHINRPRVEYPAKEKK